MSSLKKQIERQLNKQLKDAMDRVGKTVMLELADYVWDNWYKANNPIEYNRTFEFIESITKTSAKFVNGGFQVKVYFDSNKIKAKYDEYSGWNQHMSLSQEDVSNAVVGWIEYGNNPSGSSKIPYEYEGIHMIENMVKWLEKEYINLLKRELKIKTL